MTDDPIYSNKRLRRTFATSWDDDRLTWERSTPEFAAPVFVHEDDLTVNLQIELADDYAMLISVRKDGREPVTPVLTLWHGSGEHDLEPERWQTLRGWFERAIVVLVEAP